MVLGLTILLSCAGSLLVNVLMKELDGPVVLIGSLLRLSLVFNPYIAFGIPLPGALQTILIFGAFIGVCFIALQAKDMLARIAFGLIIGGAAANIIDRMMDGFVTDYVSFGTFPVFNMADICISIGAGLLLWEGVKNNREKAI